MPPARASSSTSDHDLLIEIKTRLELLQSTVQESRTALSARIDRLAQEKADNGSLDTLRQTIERAQQTNKEKEADQDKDIAFSQRMIYIAIGAIGVAEPLLLALLAWLMRSH
jgi:DNA-binding FadR family transcriptional regulator